MDVFLAEMVAVVPWVVLEAVIGASIIPRLVRLAGGGLFPLAVMLRIYCLQQWYNLSDPGAEEALYDICSMRARSQVWSSDATQIFDETTILNFRHLLERHELTEGGICRCFEASGGPWCALLRGGTIVDATPIAASPSAEERAQKRDPEMRSSKKGQSSGTLA